MACYRGVWARNPDFIWLYADLFEITARFSLKTFYLTLRRCFYVPRFSTLHLLSVALKYGVVLEPQLRLLHTQHWLPPCLKRLYPF